MEVIELNVEVIIVEEGDLDLVEPAREVRLGNLYASRHTYSVGVGEHRREGTIKVDANDRNHATRIAERAGYSVRDVNMIG